MSIYGNDYDRYRVYEDVGTGTIEYSKYFWGTKSFAFFGSYTNPSRFLLRGTDIDGVYNESYSKVNVTLTNSTTDSAVFIDKAAGDLSTEIENKWGFSNIATLTVEIHINMGRVPNVAESEIRSESTIPVSIPEAPTFV